MTGHLQLLSDCALVETLEVQRVIDIISPWVRDLVPFVITGPAGCGKSTILMVTFSGDSLVLLLCGRCFTMWMDGFFFSSSSCTRSACAIALRLVSLPSHSGASRGCVEPQWLPFIAVRKRMLSM